MRRRIDRFVEDSLAEFAGWFSDAAWLGKERDFVNLFALRFLCPRAQPGAAIEEISQVRIESPVPQPTKYDKPSAPKDLVVWKHGLETAWDETWRAVRAPRVVMEWKVDRNYASTPEFDGHDTDWLSEFTREYPGAVGYLVSVAYGAQENTVAWAKVAYGRVYTANRHS